MFNYDRFVGEFIPSDKNFKRISPNDPVAATQYRDAEAKCALDEMYAEWIRGREAEIVATSAFRLV